MNQIRRQIVFEVKGKEYVIKFPNLGQLWDVEKYKSIFSDGHYGSVLNNRTNWAYYNLDNIDMFAYLTALCPELMKDLNFKGWKYMDPIDALELSKAYKDQLLPWISEISGFLKVSNLEENQSDNEEVEDEEPDK